MKRMFLLSMVMVLTFAGKCSGPESTETPAVQTESSESQNAGGAVEEPTVESETVEKAEETQAPSTSEEGSVESSEE